MSISIPDVKFELRKVYKTFADQLMLAGSISDMLLGNSNIAAAGGQVEGSLRALLNELLPERVKVTHGHIVDKHANISYQQDVLIAESFFTRSLIKTLDGTEFYPFESVFTTGEVKKAWSQTHLKSAMKSIKRNKEVLERNGISNDMLATGSTFLKVGNPLSSNPTRNPLFNFTFSLSYGKTFSETAMSKIYQNRANWTLLPNVSIVMDKGIYILLDNDRFAHSEIAIKLYPEFVKPAENCQWYFLRLDPEESLAY